MNSLCLPYPPPLIAKRFSVAVISPYGTFEVNGKLPAAAGEIIGAFKAGKQWLIPTTSLRAYGVVVEIPGQIVDEEVTEPDE